MTLSGCLDRPVCTEKVHNPALTPEYEAITIPGLKSPYGNCGDIYKILKCQECEYKTAVQRTCHRVECSTCWKTWASREAERAQERIVGYKQAYKAKRNKRLGNPQNIILSPPQEEAIKQVKEAGGIEKLKKKAILLLKRHNIYGALSIYHHYRVKKEYADELRILEHETKRKLWDLIREDELGLGSWREYVYVSPHFHLKVFGVKVNGGKFYKKTGWVLKFKRHISSKDELKKVIFYELSHAAIRTGKRAVTWFGSLSYNKLSKREKTVNYEIMKCPLCGADLELEDLNTGNCEEAIAKIITYQYFINNPPRLKVQTLMEAF